MIEDSRPNSQYSSAAMLVRACRQTLHRPPASKSASRRARLRPCGGQCTS